MKSDFFLSYLEGCDIFLLPNCYGQYFQYCTEQKWREWATLCLSLLSVFYLHLWFHHPDWDLSWSIFIQMTPGLLNLGASPLKLGEFLAMTCWFYFIIKVSSCPSGTLMILILSLLNSSQSSLVICCLSSSVLLTICPIAFLSSLNILLVSTLKWKISAVIWTVITGWTLWARFVTT